MEELNYLHMTEMYKAWCSYVYVINVECPTENSTGCQRFNDFAK